MPLMADGVQIPIEALDQATPVIHKVDGAIDGLSDTQIVSTQTNQKNAMSWTDLNSVVGLAREGYQILNSVYDATIKKTLEYDDAVRELANVSGTGAEESSRLLQVLDDFKLTSGDVMAASKAMTREGLSPTIETLAALSEKYNTLNPGQEQAAFLIENFGREGFKFAEAMEAGGDALMEMGAEVEKSLIRTDAQIAKTRLAELAFDSFTDKIEAYAVATGSELIGILDGSSNQIGIMTEELYKAETGMYRGLLPLEKMTDAQRKAWQEAETAAEKQYLLSQGIDITAESTKQLVEDATEAAEALQKMTAANNGLLDLTVNIAKETAQYNEKLAEAIEKYGEGSEEVQTLAAAHSDAMVKIATDLEIAKLKADGFTDAEYQMSLALLESTGQIDAASVQTAEAMDRITKAAQNAGENGVAQLGDILKTSLADGIIDAGELQGALSLLNATEPVKQMEYFKLAAEGAKTEGTGAIDEVQAATDSLSTEQAIAQVEDLTASILAVPKENEIHFNITQTGSVPTVGSGTKPKNGEQFGDGGGSGGGQVFQFYGPTYFQQAADGSYAQI